jgi:outer membrane autotransporter protein
VVTPRDGAIFANAAFGVAEANQASLTGLLDRLAPGGDADGFAVGSASGWIQAIGSDLDPAAPDAPRFRVLSGGVEGGVDAALGAHARIGGVIGYEDGRLSDAESGSADLHVFRLGAYGSANAGRLVISGALDYAQADTRVDRPTGLGVGVSGRHVDETLAGLEASLPIAAGGTRITPQAGVVVGDVSAGAFQETDAMSSAFAVSGVGAHRTFASPFAKIAVSHDFTGEAGLVVTPAAEVGYRYDGPAAELDQTLVAADGTVFTGQSARLSRDTAVVGASLTARQGRWSGFVRYHGAFASGWNDQQLQAGIRLTF